MDALDDSDIKLQRASTDLLSEFETSLPHFLWTSTIEEVSCNRRPRPQRSRRTVSEKITNKLIRLLEPFQEWPQLLDPHLHSLILPLVSAFIEYILHHENHYRSPRRKQSATVIPLPRAVCKILYILCKVRGEKIISRFLKNEPKYIEPMLNAFQTWNAPMDLDSALTDHGPMIWEERYIMLLWLSHLMLTPFDLASISTGTCQNMSAGPSPINLPPHLPLIAQRIIPICTRYLVSASKEREAARVLLVRLTLRPDMRRVGLLGALITWAISSLEVESDDTSLMSIYVHIGTLSFLAGIIVSAEKGTIAPFQKSIFESVQRMNAEQTALSKHVVSSALARKIIIKIMRAITVTLLQADSRSSSSGVLIEISDILEDVINHLLASLADKDTPVRYAASKALSIIAIKLEPVMTAEIVEAVIGSLEENVLWENAISGQTIGSAEAHENYTGVFKRNLVAVNPLRWHGLVLTLSHLLFRRSAPPHQLPSILNAMLLALSFEQRSSVGSSVGTNVRDAACFGIWSLARRYTTQELLAVDVTSVLAVNKRDQSLSVLQLLANEIVVAATLDSSGNIRRGASAALQELVGRHPDMIENGISLVQVVDYHAVALRSRAMQGVAIGASRLGYSYWQALADGLLHWRGIGSPDAASRRLAANTNGLLAASRGVEGIEKGTSAVLSQLRRLQSHQVEERHGLLLSLAAIIHKAQQMPNQQAPISGMPKSFVGLWNVFKEVSESSQVDFISSIVRPELTTEAVCNLVSALATASPTANSGKFCMIDSPSAAEVSTCTAVLESSLMRAENTVIMAASNAANDLFSVLGDEARIALARKWMVALTMEQSSQLRGSGREHGFVAALGSVFHYFHPAGSKALSPIAQAIADTLISRTGHNIEIESRVAAIKSLSSGILTSKVMTKSMIEALEACLDDYTTDRRGDVGSLVRVEAVDAIGVAWRHGLLADTESRDGLITKVCGLAVEKLDKVRFRAWTCLQEIWSAFVAVESPPIHFSDIAHTSTPAYFLQVLSLSSISWVITPLLEGYITSAGAGSESLLRSSRLALEAHASNLPTTALLPLAKSLLNIIQSHIANDRLAIPGMEVIAFLFDASILQRLEREDFPWHTVFIISQKSHHKSLNVHRLQAAIKNYANLASIASLKEAALTKLTAMLSHPFPNIRNAAADALLLVSPPAAFRELKSKDWSQPPKELKSNVNEIRLNLLRESVD